MTPLPCTSYSIGIFDSGLGGLTVLKQLLHIMPEEHFIFYGDTARLPYGEKKTDTIIRYSLENANLLLKHNIKALVVACGTASSIAINALQHHVSVPVIGMIEPSADSALSASRSKRIAILGTKSAIRSQTHAAAILHRDPNAAVTSIACPLLVPLIEENLIDHPATRLIIREYLTPIKKNHIDTILLGCTHYSILQELIRQEAGDDVTVVDPAITCAIHVRDILCQHQLHTSMQRSRDNIFLVSEDPQKFQILGESLLKMPIHVTAEYAFTRC